MKPWVGEEYDWDSAFCVSHGGDYESLPEKSAAEWLMGESGDIPAPFGRDQVEEILGIVEGCHDESDWLLLARLKNGLFFFMSAGCDYTGWDCQSGGRIYLAHSAEKLLQFAVNADDKARMGL